MISSVNDIYGLIGLSTDTKPIDTFLKNGSLFLEMDTSTVYIFDKENERWLKVGGDTPTPPTPVDPTVFYNHYINWHGYFMVDDGSGSGSYIRTRNVSGVFTLPWTIETPLTTLEEFGNAVINTSEPIILELYYQHDENNYTTAHYKVTSIIADSRVSILFGDEVGLNDDFSSTSNWLIINSFEDYSDPDNVPQEIDELVWEGL